MGGKEKKCDKEKKNGNKVFMCTVCQRDCFLSEYQEDEFILTIGDVPPRSEEAVVAAAATGTAVDCNHGDGQVCLQLIVTLFQQLKG